MQLLVLISFFMLCNGFKIWKSLYGILRGGNNNIESFCGVIPKSCPRSPYRSMDGSCNNLKNPSWGTPNTPYTRLLPNRYADGIHSLPTSKSGKTLKSAREISLLVFKNKPVNDSLWTLNTMQFGQLLAHDMSLAGKIDQTLACCVNGKDAGTDPRCANIPIPPGDYVHPNEVCLNFIRTTTTKDNKCTANNVPADPLSAITAFMDTSFVYGSSNSQAKSLRTMQGGRMKTVTRNGQEWPPQVSKPTKRCTVKTDEDICYMAGDDRVNQNTELSLLQVLFLRKHNKVADYLYTINKHWSDEKIYQEARRIICAFFQHISYYELLPIYLGRNNMLKRKLIYDDPQGYVNDYDPLTNPGITVEHATVAYRYIHTAIAGSLIMYLEDGKYAGAISICPWMKKPSILEEGSNFVQLARGMNTQPMMAMDSFFAEETMNCLFSGDKQNGTDLRALDVQRARDHGVPTYNDLREYCGLPRAKKFSDFYDHIPKDQVDQLSKIYETPDDVEVAVAGALETSVDGAQTGPTFLCILLEQFYRTRTSDRYFYEMGNQDGSFTAEQLSSIRGASVASLFCETAGITNIQRRAFDLISITNPVVPCDQIPTIDLSLWKE